MGNIQYIDISDDEFLKISFRNIVNPLGSEGFGGPSEVLTCPDICVLTIHIFFLNINGTITVNEIRSQNTN